MVEQPHPVAMAAADRIMAEADQDADRVVRELAGGDLTSDTVEAPKEGYADVRWQQWLEGPEQRQQYADSMDPHDFLDEAMKQFAPRLSAKNRENFITMLAEGFRPQEALKIAQQLHDADQMKQAVQQGQGSPPIPPAGRGA